jgi:hypothetical protein
MTRDYHQQIDAWLDGELSAEAAAQLEAWLRADSSRMRAFVEMGMLHRELREAVRVQSLCFFENNALPTVPSRGVPTGELFGGVQGGPLGYFSSGWPVAYLVATVVSAVGLAIGAFTYVSQPAHIVENRLPGTQNSALPKRDVEFVARITAMVDCVVNNDECRMLNAELHLGDRIALKSGLVELTYDTGAKVILQGPVNYEVDSAASGYLSLGKLTAMLEKKSEIRGQRSEPANQKSEIINQTFAVRTPSAIVTDLGTEFGVEVSKKGHTTSHVYRGSVRLQAISSDGKVEGAAKVLYMNESARVENRKDQDGDRILMLGSSVKQVEFVRAIPKQTAKIIDLADVVAGGDGFSGRRNRGIDPRDGRAIDVFPKERLLIGDGRYHRFQGRPFVDGVFIPGRAGTPVQLDSDGHTFANFSTTENQTSGAIWAGPQGTNHAKLGQIDYASSDHGLLALNPNNGVTFDLEAIRRANPDSKLIRFRAVVGNTVQVGRNLVANGDFSNGRTGWWNAYSGSVAADRSSPDGHNLLILGQVEVAADMRSISLLAGQKYDVSFMATSPDRSARNGAWGSPLWTRLFWNDPSGKPYGELAPTFSGGTVADLNTGWATYRTTFTMPQGHDGTWLQICFDTPVGGKIAIDNVVVAPNLERACSDVCVFVDGALRFHRREINSYSGAIPVIVPINTADRFLTLAVTANADDVIGASTMFGDPRLELISTKAALDSTPPRRTEATH